jgi:hypothetical protein
MPCNISLAGATSITLLVTRPDSTITSITMTADVTNTIAQYVTTSSDFTQVGTYQIQLKVVFPVGTGYPNGRTLYTAQIPLYVGAVI